MAELYFSRRLGRSFIISPPFTWAHTAIIDGGQPPRYVVARNTMLIDFARAAHFCFLML